MSFQADGSAGYPFAGIPEWHFAKPNAKAVVQKGYKFAWNEMDERQRINALHLVAVPRATERIQDRGPLRPPGPMADDRWGRARCSRW